MNRFFSSTRDGECLSNIIIGNVKALLIEFSILNVFFFSFEPYSNARATMRGRCSARAASLRSHLPDDFEQGDKLVPENPKDEGEYGTDGHDALGHRGTGARRVLDPPLDKVQALTDPFDPLRGGFHNYRQPGPRGMMKHHAESM